MINGQSIRLDRYEVRMLDDALREGWFSCMAANFGHAQELAEDEHPNCRVLQINLIVDGEAG